MAKTPSTLPLPYRAEVRYLSTVMYDFATDPAATVSERSDYRKIKNVLDQLAEHGNVTEIRDPAPEEDEDEDEEDEDDEEEDD